MVKKGRGGGNKRGGKAILRPKGTNCFNWDLREKEVRTLEEKK